MNVKFKSMSIKNFRNFIDINIHLDNRNVFFGLNDVGKTNFLYAIRYVLDGSVRRNNMQESDYHCKDTSKIIELCIEIDLSDDDDECKIIRARAKGAIYSNTNNFYIRLYTEPYDKSEQMGLIHMEWGSDLQDLEEISSTGSRFAIDSIFNVVYIDVYEDMQRMFSKNRNKFFSGTSDTNADDVKVYDAIKENKNNLEENIHKLSKVKSFEDTITKEFNGIMDIGVKLESEINVGDFYSSLKPYMHDINDDNIYPVSGEGRRKLLIYTMYKMMSKSKEYNNKINIFLIEEPENNLHRSIQIVLSKLLFSDDEVYKYLFMSTHSSNMMSYMNNANLIRVYMSGQNITSESYLYVIDDDFKENKNQYNRALTDALFVKRVLMVEGPSELLLFEKVLSTLDQDYELKGIFIMTINGIYFGEYKKVLDRLKIKNYIKTDNDLQKISSKDKTYFLASGLNRCNKFLESYVGSDTFFENIKYDNVGDRKKFKIKIYEEHKDKISEMQNNYRIYLSEVDLEEDLFRSIKTKYISKSGKRFTAAYLREHKWKNMSELVQLLSEDDCIKIYNSPLFKCLKDLYEGR